MLSSQKSEFMSTNLFEDLKMNQIFKRSSFDCEIENGYLLPVWSIENKISELISKWCVCELSDSYPYNDKKSKYCISYDHEQLNNNIDTMNDVSTTKIHKNEKSESFNSYEAYNPDQFYESQKDEESNILNISEYHIRKDVVIKNILRTFRKFYALQFSKFYDFTKKKMSRVHPSESEIIVKVKKYALKLFGNEEMPLIALIVALLDPKGKYTQQRGIYIEMKQKVANIFLKFNKRHLYELIQIPQFIILMSYFLSNYDVKLMIPRYRDNKEAFETYSNYIQIFKSICKDHQLGSTKHLHKFF